MEKLCLTYISGHEHEEQSGGNKKNSIAIKMQLKGINKRNIILNSLQHHLAHETINLKN
mgnify:CR=1 FL=1